MTRLRNLFAATFPVITLLFAMATGSPAQTFTTLYNFSGPDGDYPYLTSLTQGFDGNLYGATFLGGANTNSLCNFGGTNNTCGEVFKITPAGSLTTIYSFCSLTGCADGTNPGAGLLPATDGNFYGTTWAGGTSQGGTVYKVTPSGTESVLASFGAGGPTGGTSPQVAVIEGTDGNFYGTTIVGSYESAYGTVFKVTPSGALTILVSFVGHNGAYPMAKLIQATDGSFYGTTMGRDQGNDLSKYGSVFKVTPGGRFTTIHAFTGYSTGDGQNPLGGMVQGADGNLYGTTSAGGAFDTGTVFSISLDGSVYNVIHSFGFQGSDGAGPEGDLIQGTDGNLYGTTSYGGTNNSGTIFSTTTSGTLTSLHSFDAVCCYIYNGGLVQATNGTFYGTTTLGGTDGDGTIYSLSVGLGPFVKTVPVSGRVGQTVRILGSNLTGATSVSFNGTPAAFTVLSHSQIKTTVPAGATTGNVQVTTPSGTLNSNVAFQVQ